MSARNISPVQFKDYSLEYRGVDERGGHNIVARKDDKAIGSMRWGHGRGIDDISVDPKHQHKGIATAMWNMGIDLKKQDKSIPTLKHSQDRTDEGERWAKKVGRYYPPTNIIKFEEEE